MQKYPFYHQINITRCWHWQNQLPEVFYKKGILKNSGKFTGKHLQHATLLKQTPTRCFPVNFNKFSRTTFLQNTSK